ncbi:Dot/Icm T4SS effector Wip [Legionella worsleiensis]|uniref:WipA-like phosphatase domain-containing protein n=1 Tax=Legionella worsleiensis TaxID=45076 RepID=A0A0W1AF36_9GAMM|nr:Dot/Icm T4SS effector Wip [Legionella worsleiensis]KTD79763.1 hypothetical protein Lwor_1277 [Legionella worsleiensis]STY32274.1 Dot/Icm secretion system substrate [Legionella worsleiensis]
MVHSIIKKSQIDIYTCPKAEPIVDATELSVGDLHANAMLLLYFLVTNGVVKISATDYAQLKDIYLKRELTRNDVTAFNSIIDALVIEAKPLIRLIGDEVCDRGENDYFIFKILDKLKKSGVAVEILLSNHGIEFLIPYEEQKHTLDVNNLFAPNINFGGQAQSMNNLRNSIECGIIRANEVNSLIKDSYLPCLKLISYTLSGSVITIYSHAGVGLETIRALAEKFKDKGVVYQDDTAEQLAKTIEAINWVFAQHVRTGTVHTLPVDLAKSCDFRDDPVNFLLWNRDYTELSRNQEHNGYTLFYVHGHDSGEKTHENIVNLDGYLGKFADSNIDDFKCLGVRGDSVLHLQAKVHEALEHQVGLVADEPTDAAPEQTQPNPVRQKSASQQPVEDGVDPFLSQLTKLQFKAQSLYKDGHKTAYDSAMALHKALNGAYNLLQIDEDHDQFNKSCTAAIAQHRGQLDTHRGWSELLINLLIAIPTAGIGLLVKGAVNMAQKRSFFFVHKTESAKIVDEIAEQIPNPAKKL